ncbi:hypothetical protein [Streptomyces sp. NPDC048603]|uniref:hypothetical protein n=1 Tax=Streptomyces sp. NPDC048603 TaxID=3365577 RepID=UPI00371963A2
MHTEENDVGHTVALAIMASVNGLQPVFDAADGMRADLERRGWSPSVAEHLTAQWLSATLRLVFGGCQ